MAASLRTTVSVSQQLSPTPQGLPSRPGAEHHRVSLQGSPSQRPSVTVRANSDAPGKTAASEQTSAKAGACPGCGRADVMWGCNAEGRIQGGVGALPGFGWWPIKAYRPCPAFLEAGGKYRRKGQSLDEVAFGRKGLDDDLSISERFVKLEDSDVQARLKKLKEEEEKSKAS